VIRSCLMVAAVLAAGARQSPQTFRASVDAVRVDVLVTDGNRPVGGLKGDDFELRDNGVLQKIDAVAMEDVPLSAMFALDVSASVRDEPLTHLKQAASAAIFALKPSDRAALLTFSEQLRLAADWTSDRGALNTAVWAVTGRGATALHDVAYAALTLRDEPPRRTLVLIFTDGDDTASWLPAAAVLDIARRTDVVVYGVGLRSTHVPPGFRIDVRSGAQLGSPKELEGRPLLPSLTQETGGQMFYADRTRGLQDAFVRVVNEFKSRYLLSYSPKNVTATGWHAIDVRVKGRNLKVKARRGYQR